MVFSVEVQDDAVRLWSRDGEDVHLERDREYRPACYVSARSQSALEWLEPRIAQDPKVDDIAFVERYPSLRDREPSRVLRLECERPSEIEAVASSVRQRHEAGERAVGTFRLFNVDHSPKFRYCLETETPPIPSERLRTLSISLSERALANEDVDELTVDGEPVAGADRAVLEDLSARLEESDPDVLVLSNADIVPLLADRAEALGVDLQLGRLPGYRQLSAESTYHSYGQVGYSPARYDVPGRVIVDRSNSFLWDDGGLPGLLDLVERSWKPLQETAWGSIGRLFTAIQIREAYDRDVLVPWRAWESESFKDLSTLHEADRGGFTFEPDVGLHEDVVEVDFGSLFPNIMCEYNLSPETVRCDCHDRADVPGLGYSVCDRDGFVPDVLRPIIDDRAEIKRRIDETDDPAEAERLEGRSDALKWILVTCFGYQGFSNAKFGRIEVHESINAHAREILLDAKATLEDGGWRIVHGIIDSLWVTPRESDPEPIDALCEAISAAQSIPLEYEDRFDWVAFVPRKERSGGSLNRYFGKVAGEDEFKYRGIEVRQRSTPAFIESMQEDLIGTLDERRDPEAVCDRLARSITELRSGTIDPPDLVVKTRCSRPLEAYQQQNRTVAALERYQDHGIGRSPGQDVRYVVVDDDRSDHDRVRLPFEADDYDPEFYVDLSIRAAESVLSPLEWDESEIRRYLRDTEDTRLGAFG